VERRERRSCSYSRERTSSGFMEVWEARDWSGRRGARSGEVVSRCAIVIPFSQFLRSCRKEQKDLRQPKLHSPQLSPPHPARPLQLPVPLHKTTIIPKINTLDTTPFLRHGNDTKEPPRRRAEGEGKGVEVGRVGMVGGSPKLG